jgi:transcriptional regulator with XRE-family HTH domain
LNRRSIKQNICGKRIKLARINKEMDQVELTAALSVDCGVEISQSSISEIERGERGVRDFEAVALAQVLEVSLEWLLLGDKSSKNSSFE